MKDKTVSLTVTQEEFEKIIALLGLLRDDDSACLMFRAAAADMMVRLRFLALESKLAGLGGGGGGN